MSHGAVLNLSFYRFHAFSAEEIAEIRPRLKALALANELKGTVILAPEGVNGFLAGKESDVRQFWMDFQALHAGFAAMDAKESFSDDRPFSRLLIKVKKEIIPMGIATIKPLEATGARLDPEELKKWYDEGREFVIVDTRNQYEMELGTFENAVDPGLKTFREFPAWLQEAAKKPEYQGKPWVMFCTGGIRCEKATALGQQYGIPEVYQLEGGILRYFEKVGGAHYKGECFVFDKRVAVDPALQETSATQCYGCRAVLTKEEQEHGSHVCEKNKKQPA